MIMNFSQCKSASSVVKTLFCVGEFGPVRNQGFLLFNLLPRPVFLTHRLYPGRYTEPSRSALPLGWIIPGFQPEKIDFI